MARTTLSVCLVAAVLSAGTTAQGPSTESVAYEAVSIKRSDPKTLVDPTMSLLRDGSVRIVNRTIESLLSMASPAPVRDVVGVPDWATTERYEIIGKAPSGTTRAMYKPMIRQMLIDRMKLAGHVEEQERRTYSLVLARRDGRLGPQLKLPTLDCKNSAALGPPTPGRPGCGASGAPGLLLGGSMSMAYLANLLSGPAGALVTDRTGLAGPYDYTLKYSPRMDPGATAASPDDAPDVFTAVQEQLGLKLEPERSTVTVFVIDHLERPTEN